MNIKNLIGHKKPQLIWPQKSQTSNTAYNRKKMYPKLKITNEGGSWKT